MQRPRQPHYQRAKVIAVTRPIYPRKERIMPCPISTATSKQQENYYEVILGREVKNWFDHSQMIGIFHINSINGEDFFDARVAFHKNGMQLKKYGDSVMQLALKDTKYEEILKLQGLKTFSTVYAFSTDHKKVNTIMKILKKIPQMHLMCGVVENRLLSKDEFIAYGNMPDISIVRSQFANVLNLAASQLVKNLESHQSNLVNILEAHVRVSQKSNEPAATEVNETTKTDEPEKSS